MKFLLVQVLILAAFMYADGYDCQIAPQFWCDSEEIALKCGVLEACSSRLYKSYNMFMVESVKLSVYFESYCPDSIKFLTTMLYPTYKTLNSTGIMKVNIVPYGKAHYEKKPDGSFIFQCQHGPNECTGNIIENCLLSNTHHDTDLYLPVVQCMETAVDPVKAAEKCIKNAGLSWNTISACAHGPEGNKLMHRAGVITEQQNLTWVPWVVVNGVHTAGIQKAATTDLLKLVCDTYQGDLPKECK